MRKPAVRRGLIALAAFALVAVVALGLVMAWLSAAPITVAPLEPVVERVLAAQVENGRASVDRVQVVRYREDNALGLRLYGVSVVDGRNRPVLRARLVEAALGSDSMVLFAPAPSHLVLKDFFVAASVSPQGRFALGYDAKGPPPPLDLTTIFLSLTGQARRDRPLSYLRRVELDNGVLAFRQVGGPVAWRANIQSVAFEKASGRFNAVSRLTVDDGHGLARVFGQANGDVGLATLATGGSVSALTPARIFPAVGLTRPLSVLDAPIEGQARLQYALDRGVTAATVTGRAGGGALRLGGFSQAFEGADLATHYDAAAKQVMLDRFDLRAEKTRLALTGRGWLVPEKGRRPARIEYRLEGPHGLFTLAPSAPAQTLDDLTIAGAAIPQKARLEVNDLRVRLAGAPVRMSLAVDRGDVRRSPAIKADIVTGGALDITSLYALWPEAVAPAARAFVTPRLHAARVLSSTVHVDIPAGQLDRRKLTNDMLRVAFRYGGGGLKVHPQLPGIEDAVGTGLIQGNRFDLTMKTGRLAELAISDATVTVPRFEEGVVATVRSRARGDLGDMLRLVDSPPLGMMKASSMSPDRFSGPADLVIEIKAPLRKGATRADYRVKYEGRIDDLVIKDVTLGEKLRDGHLTTRGNLDWVEAEGIGRVGPYAGKIDFRMPLKGRDAGRKHITLDGKASLLGAEGAPFHAFINTRNGIGQAQVRSPAFNGKAEWRKGERALITGVSQRAGWKQAGFPAGPGLPARIPVRIAMTYDGARWVGDFDADAYSGRLTYAKVPARTVSYAAEITPDEARRIGVGELPMFATAQPIRLEAHMGEHGSVAYRVGELRGQASWTAKPQGGFGYRFATNLDQADLDGLGIPLHPTGLLSIEARGAADKGAVEGVAQAAGATIRYTLTPIKAGRRDIAVSGSAPEATFLRLGLPVGEMMDGRFDFDGRLSRTADGFVSGRLTADLGPAALRVPNSGWSKPEGAAGSAALDLVLRPDGTLRLQHITADAPGLEVRGEGGMTDDVLSVTLSRARLDGFFDGKLSASSGPAGLKADVDGRYLDFRPILKAAQEQSGGGAGGGSGEAPRIRLNADLARVRVTDEGYVRDVKLAGGWGALKDRVVNLAAKSEKGSPVSIKVYPDKGATALSLYVGDLGDIAQSLAGYANLRGGETTGTGRIVEGGYDFNFEIRDMTILRVPGAAQLVATNGAIQFDRLVAPMKIRGEDVILEDVIATGRSVGLTARGVMDTKTKTLDVVGVVTPAYNINGALGGLLGAPEGEGLFGVTYKATGPFDDPKIDINPLSAIAPGFLRRLFEGPTPRPD
ncbi:MAG TPA: DUF3971 domain-containing protein [Caulobacteraceae bacterium]